MIQKIADNIVWRNLLILLVFLSPNILQGIAVGEGADTTITRAYSYALMFSYFIFHNRVLYEKLLARKKYLAYLLCFIITMFVWREGTSYVEWLIRRPVGETRYQFRELKEYNWGFWVFIYWANVVYVYISLGVYISFKYIRQRERLLQIENMQRELELKQLSEQLNPHFLFNALNNIYSHILRNSGNAGLLVIKLGELMRYVLDSSHRQTVLLDEEILFIENYMAFEKERTGKRCDVLYTKNIAADNFRIVPLILFNFIENAFKYGTLSADKAIITIQLKADDEGLELYTRNPVWDEAVTSTQTGMTNTRRRLQLLYQKNYELYINHTATTYEMRLKLKNMYEA